MYLKKIYLKGLYWISVVKYINPFSLISRLLENIIECYHVCFEFHFIKYILVRFAHKKCFVARTG